MRLALVGLALLACTVGKPKDPQAQLTARHNAELDEMARRHAAEQQRKEAAEAEQQRHAEEKRERDHAAYQDEKRASAERVAARLEELRERQAETQAARDADPGRKWVAAHCTIEQPEPIYELHSDPICWREETWPCPVYRCSSQPPEQAWLTDANRRACGAPTARAIGGGP